MAIWQIWFLGQFHHSIIEVLQNCSAFCVIFFRVRKSEKIWGIFFFSKSQPYIVHREKKKTIHSCPHCDKQFEIKKTMTYHMFNVHGDEKVAHFRLVLFLSLKNKRRFQVTYSLYLLLFWSRYTQYPIIRNGHIRNASEIWGNFKKQLVSQLNLRNAVKKIKKRSLVEIFGLRNTFSF